MSTKQPAVFENTLQKTNIWLREICGLMHWDSHQSAYHALRAVLHALRDRLPVPEVAHLGAQLPMLIRGIYYEDWKPGAKLAKAKTAQEFYDVVKENFTADQNENPMRLTNAVMQVLGANLSGGEQEKLRDTFPPHLREIWPEQATADTSDYD